MLWRFIIVLAFLLVRHSCAKLNASTEDPPQPPSTYRQYESISNDDKYDVVDVAQQNGDSNSAGTVQTGQTTRIFTTGEVDDAFWLAQLGEDFKHAIHLQVGGNENYNGIYNMSGDGSFKKIQHEYPTTSNENPVENNSNNNNYHNVINNNYATDKEYTAQNFNNYDTTTEAERNEITKRDSSKAKLEQIETKDKPINNYTNNSVAEKSKQQQYESILFDNNHKISTKGKRKNRNRPAKVQQTSLKHTTKSTKTKNTKNNRILKGKTTKSYDSPVVVNLPQTQKTIHHLDEMPVVVKMPPVIYHQNSIFEDIDKSEVQIHTHAQPHNTHTHANKNTHPEQTQSNTSTDTQYTQYSMTHNQQTQQQQTQQQTLAQYSPYEAHNYYNPSTYESDSDGSSSYNTQNIYQHSNQNSDESTQNHRYIVSSKPASSTSSSSSSSSPSSSNYDSTGRSSRELFNQGL